jgi:hypothetical protein
LRECLAGGGGERGEADGPAVDYRLAAGGPCGVVERLEDLAAGVGLAPADAEAGEVDQRLEDQLRGGLAAGLGSRRLVGVELRPAQDSGQVRHRAVAGDERGEVAGPGRAQRRIGVVRDFIREPGNAG